MGLTYFDQFMFNAKILCIMFIDTDLMHNMNALNALYLSSCIMLTV